MHILLFHNSAVGSPGHSHMCLCQSLWWSGLVKGPYQMGIDTCHAKSIDWTINTFHVRPVISMNNHLFLNSAVGSCWHSHMCLCQSLWWSGPVKGPYQRGIDTCHVKWWHWAVTGRCHLLSIEDLVICFIWTKSLNACYIKCEFEFDWIGIQSMYENYYTIVETNGNTLHSQLDQFSGRQCLISHV